MEIFTQNIEVMGCPDTTYCHWRTNAHIHTHIHAHAHTRTRTYTHIHAHAHVKELALEEVTKMSVTVRCLVHVKEALVDCLLKFKSSLESVHGGAPLGGTWLGDVLEDDLATSLVLVLDQLLPVLPLLVGRLLEEGGESGVGDVIPVKVGGHGHIDVAGVELHVDLLIDQSLALLLEVLSDPGNHLGVVSDSFPVFEFSFLCCSLVPSLEQLGTNLCKCWKVTPH